MPTNLRFLFFLLFLPFAITITGCQVGGSKSFIQGDSIEDNNAYYDGEPVTGDWIIMNLLDEPESLNPFTSTSASATNIYNGYIYETFLRTYRRPPWDDEPLLVERLPEISADHLVYKWRLRPDIYFHDDHPLTMQDAVFSLKAIMNPYVDDLPTKPYYAELDSLEMINDLNLVMYCSQPYFLHAEFLGSFNIMPRHIFDADRLMDDLTYFQVKNGGAFGRVAGILENLPDFLTDDLKWKDLYRCTALASLEKSIERQSDGKIEWSELESIITDLSVFEQYNRVLDFLENHTNGASPLRSLKETEAMVRKALGTLPLTAEIAMLSSRESFPLRDSLMTVCRDIHDRIEKFGLQFNKHEMNRSPTVGSGPYKFEHWKTGLEISLVRNENYWRGEGHAYLDRIVWRVLTDVTASLVALKNGEIDFLENLQTIQYLTMTNRQSFLDNFVKSTYVIPSYGYLGWRNSHPIFADKRVRRAMTHMVRRVDLRDKLLFGFAEIVTGNFYRYGMDYDSSIVPFKYDPERALELLTEAGWADTDGDGILERDSLEFRFEMLVPSGSTFAQQLTSILREDLFMIGVEMTIRQLEWSVFINNYIRNHNFDACYLGWVFGMKGDPKQVWHSESAKSRGSNHIDFMNAEADSLIDAARVEFDREKRVAMYHRFQQILHEEQPYTFLFSTMRKPAYDKRFKGVVWYPFRPGYLLNEWFVPKDEQKFE
ncbi:MAG: ABC transporter substrate-binding protein [Candidatus Hatepunaea meridiana]|nr:ABC transporter substrate-binding protein [Candidatus Hatepunaea meridiana]